MHLLFCLLQQQYPDSPVLVLESFLESTVRIEVAEFVNITAGMELFPSWEERRVADRFWHQVLVLFFCSFGYDASIDVSRAVIQLACQIGISMEKANPEEQVYRTELRKLSQQLVWSIPDICLQFAGKALASLSIPISSSLTRSYAEAAPL